MISLHALTGYYTVLDGRPLPKTTTSTSSSRRKTSRPKTPTNTVELVTGPTQRKLTAEDLAILRK
jgi:hypothetical protein